MTDFKEYLISRLDQIDNFYDKSPEEQHRIVLKIEDDHIDHVAELIDRARDDQ